GRPWRRGRRKGPRRSRPSCARGARQGSEPTAPGKACEPLARIKPRERHGGTHGGEPDRVAPRVHRGGEAGRGVEAPGPREGEPRPPELADEARPLPGPRRPVLRTEGRGREPDRPRRGPRRP